MAKAKKVKQLSFITTTRSGLLSEITTLLTKARVNITAICAYEMDNKAYFMLHTNSNAKAKKALDKLWVAAEEDNVIAVDMPNKAGELQKVAKKIADAGINVTYMYGSAGTGKSSICIFKTADDMKAIKVINRKK